MIKCADCDNKAVYTHAEPGVNPVNYCSLCLPVWLRDRASEGHFPLVEPIVEAPKAEQSAEAKPEAKAEEPAKSPE
jgi:hypothetical protein